MLALAKWQPWILSLLRIVAGFMLSLHGFQKILGFLGGMGGSGTTATFPSLPCGAGWLEVGGGLLLLAGLFSRPVAFLLSGLMAVAYFKAHAPKGFFPVQNGGELAAIYSFVFLYLCLAGPGPLSLDKVIRKKA